MVSIKEITNKEGKTLKTKDGIVLKEYRLENQDIFIPVFNDILEQKNEFEGKTIINHKIKAKVVDIKGKIKDGEEIYLSLTPTQAKTIQKKLDNNIEINQELFICYEYESENYGLQLGVGIKGNTKPAKNFDDFKEE